MPQVYFDTNTFRGEVVRQYTTERIDRMRREHPEVFRKIRVPYTIVKVPGFYEAARDNFEGWHLHHIGGEMIPATLLRDANLYERRPCYELRFMRDGEHRAIHLNDDFKDGYYGLL